MFYALLWLRCCCSDGRDYPFLAKPKDDLRKDYRLMDFAGEVSWHNMSD
jgi:phosphatidylinositol kinase/protein kinase (PI-3  family)